MVRQRKDPEKVPLAPASPPASPLESEARLVRGRVWEATVTAWSSLWVKEAVPVSLTLAPGPAVEELLDEVLGLLFHVPSGRGPLSEEVGQVAGEAFKQLLEGTGKGAAGGRAQP